MYTVGFKWLLKLLKPIIVIVAFQFLRRILVAGTSLFTGAYSKQMRVMSDYVPEQDLRRI